MENGTKEHRRAKARGLYPVRGGGDTLGQGFEGTMDKPGVMHY